MIARLESENEHLRRELDARTEEIRRRDHLIAGFIERLPQLPTTTTPETARGETSGTTEATPLAQRHAS